MSKIYTLFYGGGFDDNNPPVFSTNNNGVNKKELKKMVKSELNKSLGKSIDKTVEKSVDKAIDKAVNDMDIKLEGENLDYKLMVNGNENGEINIPKDQFLKTIAYDSDAKKLIFTIETTEGEKVTEVNISEASASGSLGSMFTGSPSRTGSGQSSRRRISLMPLQYPWIASFSAL